MTTVSDETIKSYMRNISAIPLVSREEEVELAGLIKQGSEEAREKLIVSNLRLVVKIAHDYKSLGIPLNDLIAEGNIGLMKAVERFRPDKGAKFSSYAAWWIKQAIRRVIANQSRIIRIPIQSANKINKIHKVSMKLAEELGRIPTSQEIASELDIAQKTVDSLKGCATSGTVSLNDEFTDGETGTLGDILPDPNTLAPDHFINQSDVMTYLNEVIDSKLKGREKLIICLRYGIGYEEPKTLEEVSEIIGRTRERVRQIQHQALRKLALHMEEVKTIALN